LINSAAPYDDAEHRPAFATGSAHGWHGHAGNRHHHSWLRPETGASGKHRKQNDADELDWLHSH